MGTTRRIGTSLAAVLAGIGLWQVATTAPDLDKAPAAMVRPDARSGLDSADPVMRPPALDPRLAHEAVASLPSAVTITIRGSLLGVTAHEATLREVLAAVGRASGIAFTGVDGAVERVSASLGPLPPKDLIGQLLARTSYGYAYLDPFRAGERTRVVLVPTGVPVPATAPGQQALRPTKPLARVDPPDPEAMREQQATDAMFDACKAQACDSS